VKFVLVTKKNVGNCAAERDAILPSANRRKTKAKKTRIHYALSWDNWGDV
jgi:hypothetical protein